MDDSVDSVRLKQLRLRLDTEDQSFPGLKRLKLSGKDLTKLPREVFYLAELELLNLSPERQSCLYFRLLEVPPDIGRLVNLKVLMLDTNGLEQVPEELGELTRLERLTLSNNSLTALPSSFSKLQQLQSLHLANNCLTAFPQGICTLKHLEFLDLSDNQVQEVPRDISKLFNLHTLILFYNHIKTLPDTICGMTSLHCLWIGNNNISKLPKKFGQLHHLDWGNAGKHMLSSVIDGNPLNDPPIEVCRQGVKVIAQYFEDKDISKRPKDTPASNDNSRQESPLDSRGRKTTVKRDQGDTQAKTGYKTQTTDKQTNSRGRQRVNPRK